MSRPSSARKLSVLAMLLAAPFLAGCLGGEAPGEPVDPATQDPTGGVNPGDAADEVDNATEDASEYVWKKQEYSGTIVTVGPVNAPSASQTVQRFEAGEETREILLDVTTQGGDVMVLVADPDCSPNSGCEDSFSTSAGSGQYSIKTPKAGEWTIRFFGNAIGPAQIQWKMMVSQEVPA
ncbi:MAG TPA: hypothetical protein VM681_03825 [Candidatus Thermoplasmatota archaeon]|nr:hypothetical protein [Candidatus Thermoplasmatota archaeon]